MAPEITTSDRTCGPSRDCDALGLQFSGPTVCWAAIYFAALIANPTTAASIAAVAIATDHEFAGLTRRQACLFTYSPQDQTQ
jgi:hypothetical protein